MKSDCYQAEDLQFDFSLLESMIRVARHQTSTLLRQISELRDDGKHISVKDISLSKLRAMLQHDRVSRGSLGPTVSNLDTLVALIFEIDTTAESLLMAARQVWGSTQYVSGNIHKIDFGTSAPTDDHCPLSTMEYRLRRLPELAALLTEQSALLQKTFDDISNVKA